MLKHYGDETYFRTEEELNYQLKGLIEIVQILNTRGIDYFLSAGTMLGAVRQQDFIRWDWNVSLLCLSEQFDNQYYDIKAIFIDAGFTVKDRIKKGFYAINIFKNGVKFIIESSKINGMWRELPEHRLPAKFFNTKEIVKIRGHEFNACNPAVEFLIWLYGDNWETPQIVKHRNECLTGNSKKKRTVKC